MSTNYVVGFLFSEDGKRVALIEKQKPDWQLGKLNGIGGKIESYDQSPFDAMAREFLEEAGLALMSWRPYCQLQFRGGVIHFFKTTGDVDACKTNEDEKVIVVNVADIHALPTIPNLRWLIPMALDKDNVTATVIDKS